MRRCRLLLVGRRAGGGSLRTVAGCCHVVYCEALQYAYIFIKPIQLIETHNVTIFGRLKTGDCTVAFGFLQVWFSQSGFRFL